MKAIDIIEYTYILHKYGAQITVTDAEFTQLKNSQIDIEYLVNKYDIKYDGYSTPIYEDEKIDSYEFIGKAV